MDGLPPLGAWCGDEPRRPSSRWWSRQDVWWSPVVQPVGCVHQGCANTQEQEHRPIPRPPPQGAIIELLGDRDRTPPQKKSCRIFQKYGKCEHFLPGSPERRRTATLWAASPDGATSTTSVSESQQRTRRRSFLPSRTSGSLHHASPLGSPATAVTMDRPSRPSNPTSFENLAFNSVFLFVYF